MTQGDALELGQVPSLLVVDDDDAVLKVTRRSLERRGFRVVACNSGEEALLLLGQTAFDCMISDVQMPGINGLRLLRAVRDRDLDIPVILMTGSPEVASAAAAVEYGAHQYLIKPVGNERLTRIVERAVSTGRMARLKREFAEQCGSGVFLVGDRACVDAALERALGSAWMAYQPIVHKADGRIFAQEALLRSEEPALPHPGAVLEAAARAQRLWDVGRLVRERVAATVAAASEAWQFFVNLHPEDLSDPALYLEHAPLSAVAARVVLEITERVSLETMPGVQAQIARLRQLGFRIALDDLGAGYAGLTSFVRLEPEFVKLDMSLIRDVHQSEAKQKIIGSMVELCHDMGKQIIAEGVEQRAERDVLVELGCDLLQGYFFAKPARLSLDEQRALG
jgi:EAL domain-containing protein (putative c-di-GMP-specific phosphodiesterase class I)/ActR/RegA family two-component response regulator